MLPRVKVGACDYAVKRKPISDMGGIDYARQEITVRRGLQGVPADVTLWHEILHAVYYNAGMVDHPEQHIDALAHAIVQVLRDNPLLLDNNGAP